MGRINMYNTIILWILLFTFNTVQSQEIIEGLFYRDHSPVSVEIKDGKISGITRLKELQEYIRKVYIAPGLIENQVNGFTGVTFALGGSELIIEGIQKATKAIWAVGITTYLPTLTTNSHDIFLMNLSLLNKAKDDPSLLGSIAGFHLFFLFSNRTLTGKTI